MVTYANVEMRNSSYENYSTGKFDFCNRLLALKVNKIPGRNYEDKEQVFLCRAAFSDNLRNMDCSNVKISE